MLLTRDLASPLFFFCLVFFFYLLLFIFHQNRFIIDFLRDVRGIFVRFLSFLYHIIEFKLKVGKTPTKNVHKVDQFQSFLQYIII